MPIEIGKLNVTVSVNQAKPEGGEGSSTPPSDVDARKRSDPDKITKDVVEQVMKILEDQRER